MPQLVRPNPADPVRAICYQPENSDVLTPEERLAAGPLLDAALEMSHSDGAYLYRYTHASGHLDLVAWRGMEPIHAGHYSVHLSSVAGALDGSNHVVTVGSGGASDPRFASFPEFVGQRFESVVSVPLWNDARTVGLANFCRRQAREYEPEHASFLRKLGTPLAALFDRAEGRRLTSLISEAQQSIAERRTIDSAKRLLRDKNGWSEDQAYASLRKISRKRRERLFGVAQFVLDHGHLPAFERGAD